MKACQLFFVLCLFFFNAQVLALCNPNIVKTKPDSIYIVSGNGTVTDRQTGLIWQQCSLGLSGANCETGSATMLNWQQALEVASAANSGAGTSGFSDWRLPNYKELFSLVETACDSPAINSTVFPQTLNDWYWTSSPLADVGDHALAINFLGGEPTVFKYYTGYVRLVRGGQ